MIKISLKTLSIGLFLGAHSIALAVPVTFDFTGSPNNTGDPLTYSEGGIDLTINGYPDPAVAVDLNLGLGVNFTQIPADSEQIDGAGRTETLEMEFSPNVQLLSVTFGNVQQNDGFTLSVDGTEFFNGDIPGLGQPFINTSSSNLIGSTFTFGVTENNDDYFIRNITVQAIATPESGTTLVLAGLGILGLTILRACSVKHLF